MESLFSSSEAFVRAVGWALLHSLWQGAALALLLWVLLRRIKTAQSRYWLAYSMLPAMLFAALFTAWFHYEPLSSTGSSAGAIDSAETAGGHFQVFAGLAALSIKTRLEANYPVVVAVWLMGFCFFMLRLGGGLWYVQTLRTRGVSALPPEWLQKTEKLAARLGLKRPPVIGQSALVASPLTLGWLKPVVLLPVGLINRLTPAEVEAVLAHELAHIARRDWVFNLLQSFIESLFYYHPAVWYVSSMIRRERENCCDDAAVAAVGSPLIFAKALVGVQEMAKSAVMTPALALRLEGPGKKSTAVLLQRVRRILNQPQTSTSIMEKFFASAILIALLCLVGLRAGTPPTLSAAFEKIAAVPAQWLGMESEQTQIAADSLPKPKTKPKQKIVREDDDQKVEIELEGGELTRLNIDGKEIPAAEFDRHEDLVDEVLSDMITPPAPPAPFGSGNGFYFHTPEPPTAPRAHGGRFHEFPPLHAPAAPEPPQPPKLVKEKGPDGSTILRITDGEDPVVITIKDGKVWKDGVELADGESLELPELEGFSFLHWGDGAAGAPTPQAFGFGRGYAQGLGFSDNLFDLYRLQEGLEGMDHLGDLSEVELDELKKQLEKSKKSINKEKKALQKELEAHQKALRKEQESLNKAHREALEDLQERQREIIRLHDDELRAYKEAARAEADARRQAMKANRDASFWRENLVKDNLLESGDREFSLKLNNKSLSVNGKKQSEEMHQRYLDLYERRTGRALGKDGNFSFNWTE